jgi:hypothetical protein
MAKKNGLEHSRPLSRKSFFPEPISFLPQADIPLKGVQGFLSQSENHQVMFFECNEEVELPEHSHSAQVCLVLAGCIDIVIGACGEKFSWYDKRCPACYGKVAGY